MFALTGVPRNYPWGSPDRIPRFVGERSSSTPVAELWFGAHPSAPSELPELGMDLGRFIAADPVRVLGEAGARHGGELPFLLKLIAPAAPLSMQVHPTATKAREGYARAIAGGAGAPRDYVDGNHKPELLYPLTEFTVLAGLREPADAADVLGALDHAALDPVKELLHGGCNTAITKAAFTYVLTHVGAVDVEEISALARQHADEADPQWAAPMEIVGELARAFPGDAGVVASLLLQHRVLRPGQALFIPAGVVHMYLDGFGVEIMANSDNVIRAGLTTKNVDIPELVRVIEPAHDVHLPEAECLGAGVRYFPAAVGEFRATVAGAQEEPTVIPGAGPRIVLALAQVSVRIHGEGSQWRSLERGRALFVPADRAAVEIRRGEVFHAGIAD